MGTIKYGDPDDLKDYKGGRTLKDLHDFAAKLSPSCNPQNLDKCTEDEKTQITLFTDWGAEKREAVITEKNQEIEKLEADFTAFKNGLNKEFTAASEKKEEVIKAIKDSGLGLLKAVATFQKQKGEL